MSQKRKLTSYTLAQKYEILFLLDEVEKVYKLSKEYGIPKGYISKWAQPENKQKILSDYESGNSNVQRKKVKEGKYVDIEEALLERVRDVRSRPNPIPINGKLLQAQAEM